MEKHTQITSEQLSAALIAYKCALQDLACMYAASVGGVNAGRLTDEAKAAHSKAFGPMAGPAKEMESMVWAEVDRVNALK